MFRFVHTADIHLDSPLRSLALKDPEIAELIGNATRQAFERTVTLCLEERVDALMIAGDLFDGDLKSMKSAIFFGAQMHRLAAAEIRVFIIRGNHDAESRLTKQLSLPANVHLFSGRAEAVRIDEKEVAVHGISFAEPKAPESLLPKFKAPLPGLINIGMLHTSLSGAEGHDTYSPCHLNDLFAQGYDYWALGHIHKRQVFQEDRCHVVMPGIPQGRHIGEAGPKSVTLATIDTQGQIDLSEEITAVAEFARASLDVTAMTDWTEVLDGLEGALKEARAAARAEHLVVRLELSGDTPLAGRLRRDGDQLLAEARTRAAAMTRTAVEKVVTLDTSPPGQRQQVSGGDPLTELAGLIEEELLQGEAFRSEVQGLVADLQKSLPPELRDRLLLAGRAAQEVDLPDGDLTAEALSKLIRDGAGDVLARLEDSGRAE